MYAKEVGETAEAILFRLSSMVDFSIKHDEEVESNLQKEGEEVVQSRVIKDDRNNSTHEIEKSNVHTCVTPDGKIISEDCFIRCRPIFDKLRREQVPLTDIGCIMCGALSARLSADLNAGVCDTCVIVSKQQELAAQELLRQRDLPIVFPDQISSTLFIGPKESAMNFKVLETLGIKRILVCCSHLDECFPVMDEDKKIIYHRLPLADSLDQNLLQFLPSALAFLADGERKDEKVLVHCNAGVSRSGAVVVAYLMATLFNDPNETSQNRYEKAYSYAKQKRNSIFPNSNFIKQLCGN